MNRSPTPGVRRGAFCECSLGVFVVFVDVLRNVRNLFIQCMLHIRRTKVWFLVYKKGGFTTQKGGF